MVGILLQTVAMSLNLVADVHSVDQDKTAENIQSHLGSTFMLILNQMLTKATNKDIKIAQKDH